MSLYSSREPFNDDPFPYQSIQSAAIGLDYRVNEAFLKSRPEQRQGYVFKPRPQNNPTNPILAKLRTLKKAHWGPWIDGFMDQSTKVYFPSWDQDQVDHARKVLTRLAALEKEES